MEPFASLISSTLLNQVVGSHLPAVLHHLWSGWPLQLCPGQAASLLEAKKTAILVHFQIIRQRNLIRQEKMIFKKCIFWDLICEGDKRRHQTVLKSEPRCTKDMSSCRKTYRKSILSWFKSTSCSVIQHTWLGTSMQLVGFRTPQCGKGQVSVLKWNHSAGADGHLVLEISSEVACSECSSCVVPFKRGHVFFSVLMIQFVLKKSFMCSFGKGILKEDQTHDWLLCG